MSAQARVHSVQMHQSRRSSVRFRGRAVALLLISLAVMLLMVAPLRGYLEGRSQLADLRIHAEQLDKQNATLRAQIAQLSDATYLELLARECLGMVKPGDTAFVIVPTHGRPNPPDC